MSVFDCLKWIFFKRPVRVLQPTQANPLELQQPEIENQPIYRIDRDKDGLFIRLVHVSSSIHRESIERDGLLINENLFDKAVDYGLTLNNGLSKREVEALFRIPPRSDEERHAWTLIRARIDVRNFLYSLHLSGASVYMKNAAQSGATDGGEIFAAVRRFIARRNGIAIAPRFPNAKPILCIFKSRLKENESGVLESDEIDLWLPITLPELKSEMDDAQASEVRIIRDIPADRITILDWDKFDDNSVKIISDVAAFGLV